MGSLKFLLEFGECGTVVDAKDVEFVQNLGALSLVYLYLWQLVPHVFVESVDWSMSGGGFRHLKLFIIFILVCVDF